MTGALPEKSGERREITILVLAAQNDEQAAGKGLDGLGGGVHVGGLGVVEEADAGDFRDKLEAVLDAGKTAHARGDGRGFDTQQECGCGSRQNILNVVLAAQTDVAEAEQCGIFAGAPEDDLAVLHKGAASDAPGAAEPIGMRPRGSVLHRPEHRRR